MKREELEHIIRACGEITNQYDFMVVGSQSILGPIPYPEAVFTVSMEADVYPINAPELANKIDGAIGEGSWFHDQYGYYAQGVGPETAVLPGEWRSRLHRVQNGNTNGRAGFCLDVRDLFLAKAVAGREQDREFCKALFEYHYVRLGEIIELVPSMPIDQETQRKLNATIRRWAISVKDAGHDILE